MKRFVKPQSDNKKTLILIAIAATMMVAVDFANTWLLAWQARQAHIEVVRVEQETTEAILLPQPEASQNDFSFLRKPKKTSVKTAKEYGPSKNINRPKTKPLGIVKNDQNLKIAIIIDDLGMNKKRSNQVINIGQPLTLALLPYAPNIKKMAAEAKDLGHELVVHMPMEAINAKENTGPIALKDDMSRAEVDEQLAQAFASFDGYVGLNNHMGSRVTQNEVILTQLMGELRERDLFFIDSVTTPRSVAYDTAYKENVPVARRDVFLDHHEDIDSVRQSFRRLEQTARRNGYAIGIGHPKSTTIQALKEWLPTLKKKNITIVPVQSLLKRKPGEKPVLSVEADTNPPIYGPFLPTSLAVTSSEALLFQPPTPLPAQ